MPQMDDIAFYKKDGTTLTKWVAKTPSSGDSTAAQWRVDDASTVAIGRPSMSMIARFNANKTLRRMTIDLVQPELRKNAVTGAVSVTDKIMASLTTAIPQSIDDSRIDDFVAMLVNTISSDKVRECIRSGYSAS